ncbi:hypothetical protein KY321_00160, partial [Candidatus Woesearchaeota archaeon]|nr:hypothetical protein [Candidatus Woesearchaeota archaeon]
MKIITGADSNHKNYVKCIIEDCDRLNYPIQVYDYDGSLGFGKQFSLDFKMPQEKVYHAKIQMKPLVILDALYNSEPDELIVYVDSDIVIQHSFDEIDSKDYDVGLTLHPKGFYENNNTKNKNRVGL